LGIYIEIFINMTSFIMTSHVHRMQSFDELSTNPPIATFEMTKSQSVSHRL